MAGRGWGKTRTGAEDIAAFSLWNPGARVAVVAPTFADARDVCVEGESGLLRLLPAACVQAWHRSTGDLSLYNGARIKIYSADQPERLRGPQYHRVWCDELGAWSGRGAFDQIGFGLRLGRDPRIVVTTTPRNTPLMRALLARQGQDVWVTQGRTYDNADHLAPVVLQQLRAQYEGTRLGRQELDAEMLGEEEGALWKRGDLETLRVGDAPKMARIVVGVDPAMTFGPASDETGIIAAGLGEDGLFYVLADWSGRFSPDGWAGRAMALAQSYHAEAVIAEVNAGGALVEKVLRQIDAQMPIRAVRAIRGKFERALPIAALYEQGRVRHVGRLEKLEDQMCSFSSDGLGEGSPDRVDALVWALTGLVDQAALASPRVRAL